MSSKINNEMASSLKKAGYLSLNDICQRSPVTFANSLAEIPRSLSLFLYKEASARKASLGAIFGDGDHNQEKINTLPIDPFFTQSSMSLLEMAMHRSFPVTAPRAHQSDLVLKASFDDLDNINFYVKNSNQSQLNIPPVSFDDYTDEAQYLSQVMFQNMVMKKFQNKHPGLSKDFGESLKPNDKVLAMGSGKLTIQSVYNEHENYFSTHLAEYISAILQNEYSQLSDVKVEDRLAYNSWDMIRINSRVKIVEEGNDYKSIIDKLHCIAASYCLGGGIENYKMDASHWVNELMSHYSDNEVIIKLISKFEVQTHSLLPFKDTMKKVNNTINKIRILNTSSGGTVSEKALRQFETKMLGCVVSGFALSMNWGKSTKKNSVLWNKQNYIDTVKILKNDSAGQADFWKNFFTKNSPDKLWDDLNTLGLENYTIQDKDAYNSISKKYPELNNKTRSSFSSYLSSLLYILSVGHFAWAVATDREDGKSPLPYMSLGASFIETVFSFEVAAQKLAAFILGTTQHLIGNAIEQFGKFMGNLCTKGRVVKNAVRKVSETIFSLSANYMTKIIDGCFLALSIFSAAVASFDLAKAIASGSVADIVFASINLLIAGVAVVGSVLAIIGVAAAATVIGIVVAIVGIIMSIAQWIYEIINRPAPPLSPIHKYTNEIIRPNNLLHKDSGSFLCRVRTFWNGSIVTKLNTKDMNADWDKIPHIVDRGNDYAEPNAIVTSPKTSRIYNFSKIKENSPKYCKTSDFFRTGANIDIPNWIRPYWMENINSAVESVSSSGKTSAIFLVKNNMLREELYITDNIESVPRTPFNNKFDGGKIIDIVAINGRKKCTFLVFTENSIFQINDGVVIKVIDDYDIDGASPSYLHAFTTGDFVNVIFGISDDNKFSYHHTLRADTSGLYNQFTLQTTRDKLTGKNQTMGVQYSDAADNNERVSYYSLNSSGSPEKINYTRYGTTNIESNDERKFALNIYGGVKFHVQDNGFICFYKNAFIPLN
ncbi:hypothetical protein [Serratia proteamaculans]|uniref:hypothetical protein n=1 Tax=Serratia proteamaculans TaxID=28151 RepID=UPI002177F21A|nr:hypothetical protein [Serratia proteamaculans]CAI1663122.1 Uncharacterised protein [Serratia proteamaculans]